MSPKEILISALKGEKTTRPAWLPYVGVHGAFIIDKPADEYLKSSQLILQGLQKAKRIYNPDGLPVVFDLQVEAEALGCELHWAKDGPPSVSTHPLEDKGENWSVEHLPENLDMSAARIPLVLEATEKVVAEMGNEIAVYGLICGPFTLALHLLGNEIFMAMYDDEEKVLQLTMRCAQYCKQIAKGYIDAGVDVVAVVDPMVSQISPEHFEQFVTPPSNAVYDYIKENGAFASCFVCGDVTRNLDVMCKLNCDNISVDEQIDMKDFGQKAISAGKSFGGNLQLTVALLMGNETDCKLNALECITASGDTGFILAPGCDLPYNVPIENLQAASSIALDQYQRQAAQTLTATSGSFDDVTLPDYANEQKVIIDVITLDSLTCAPCQYMMEAAEQSTQRFDGKVVVVEHKIKNRNGVAMMIKLGVKNLPTICIDGVEKFTSIIPPMEKLNAAIEQALSKK